jgi:hypothetical protein
LADIPIVINYVIDRRRRPMLLMGVSRSYPIMNVAGLLSIAYGDALLYADWRDKHLTVDATSADRGEYNHVMSLLETEHELMACQRLKEVMTEDMWTLLHHHLDQAREWRLKGD